MKDYYSFDFFSNHLKMQKPFLALGHVKMGSRLDLACGAA